MARTTLNDRSPLEAMTGETPDISDFTDFNFYQFAIYYDPNDADDEGKGRRKLGRWLGPSVTVGQVNKYGWRGAFGVMECVKES